MTSLFASLGIARQAMLAQQYGLDVTQNNIANVNTPGYSRQRAEFVPGEPTAQDTYQSSTGVKLAAIISYRSRFLDRRVNDELQRQGELETSSAALEQVEAILNEATGSGLQSVISAFFNSFSSLAAVPEDTELRQQALTRGEQLGAQFHRIYEQLEQVQSQQNNEIAGAVSEINQLSADIARLNVEVAAARGIETNGSALVDQRQQLVDRLAKLVDINYVETESGSLTITARQGSLLVAGNLSHPWEAIATPSSNSLEVLADGVDITSTIRSGKLGGLLEVRDTQIASYMNTLDEMAATIISQVNAQHRAGSDLNGDPGGDFFIPFVPTTPGSVHGAAYALEVAITDTNKIAAAGAGSGPGSNANALNLAAIQDAKIFSGNSATMSQCYASLIFRIGSDAKSALDALDTQDQMLTQLQNQRDGTSGVSLDEEAVNLMRFQKAFEANARFFTVIDSLTEEVINLIGG